MPSTSLIRLVACSLTGLLHPLCFPNFNLGWLAWIVLVPLHFSLEHATPGQAFRYGWLAGVVAFAGTITWVITAMNQFGQVPIVVSILLMLLLATYLGLFFGLYALGYVIIQQASSHWLWIGMPALWVTLEYLRTYAFSGLPWMLLGYSQYEWLSIIQFSDITGVYGVSCLLVLVNVWLTSIVSWAWTKTRTAVLFPWQPTIIILLVLCTTIIYGHWQIQQQATLDQSAKRLSIGLVQANIEQDKKWDKAYTAETLDRYTKLSLQAGTTRNLLIWPEAATPFFFEQEPKYQEAITRIVQATNTPLLFGSPTLRFHPDGSPYLFNSAFLLTNEGQITDRYDKRHLVPFGEYIPLKSLLFFLDKLVVGIGDFQSGQGSMTMSLPAAFSGSAPTFAVPICFEVIFPDLVRRMAQEGTNFLVTITNDAWFGNSAAPYQHFAMVVFRAVENHMAFARAANTGISGFIGPDGRILAATPVFTQEAVTSSIPLRHSAPTIYTRYGDVFSWACVILTGFVLIRCRRTRQSLDTTPIGPQP